MLTVTLPAEEEVLRVRLLLVRVKVRARRLSQLPRRSLARLMMLESVKAHLDLPVRVVLDPVLWFHPILQLLILPKLLWKAL